MKKFIDKETGNIITVLNVDEAKKILEMYIEYCQGKREVKKGRLNLVNYLGDFIKYSSEKDMSKFYDILLKLKETLEFSKSEQKAYDSLLSFFEIYNKIDKGEFEISGVINFITNEINKKQLINEKINNSEELNFEEKLNNIFFNESFDLSILAKNACKKWNELLKERINAANGEIEVSLKEEIAYQDLLAFSNKDNLIVSLKNNSIENGNDKEDEKSKVLKEEKRNEEIKEEERKIELRDEEAFIGPIITSNSEEAINADKIKEATEDVSLREAADTFNDAIDASKNNNSNNSNDSSSFGTLRDM